MEVIKLFFRKKKTKIFIFASVILIFSLLIFCSLINYNKSLIQEYYDNNCYLAFSSKYDISQIILKDDRIKIIARGVVLSKIDNDFILEYSSFDTLGWTDLLYNDMAILYNSDDFGIKVNKGNIVLGVNNYIDNYNKILYKNIGFDKYNFKIDLINKSTLYNFLISHEDFNSIHKDFIFYKVIAKDYKEYNSLKESFVNNDKIDDVIFVENGIIPNNNYLSLFYYGCFCIVFFVIILFVFISKNIVEEESNNFYIERILGFNVKSVLKYFFINLVLFYFIITIFSLVFEIISILLINKIFDLCINLFNFYYYLMLFIIFFFCLIFQIVLVYLNLKRKYLMDKI